MKRMMKNPKLVAAACALYMIWPLDLCPDFIPVLGWADDLVAFGLGVRAVVNSIVNKETIIEAR